MRFLVFCLLLSCSLKAQARVFDFKNEKVATFLRGTAGLSNLKKMGYEFAGPTGINFNDESRYAYTGEFGLLLNMKSVNWRLGIELLRPQSINGISAKDAAGTPVYDLNASVLGAGGVTYLDFLFGGGASSRFYFTIGGGYAKVTLKNEYLFTAAGTATYAIPDYNEEASGWAYSAMAGLGWEGVLSDTVTFTLDAGYRYMLVQNLVHERSATTFGGTVTPGQTMKNNDNSDRKIDLSSTWVGAGLRFYLKFL